MHPVQNDEYRDLNYLIEKLARLTERLENTISNFERHRIEHKEEIKEIKGRIELLESYKTKSKTSLSTIMLIINGIVVAIGLFLEWKVSGIK